MLIHLPFPFSVIILMLHLLKRGMEKRGKKLLRLGAVVAISDVEGGLVAIATQLETSNARPSNGDGADMRGVRGVGVGVEEKREGKKLLRT